MARINEAYEDLTAPAVILIKSKFGDVARHIVNACCGCRAPS